MVLGFPSNSFPGKNTTMKKRRQMFGFRNFGVTFSDDGHNVPSLVTMRTPVFQALAEMTRRCATRWTSINTSSIRTELKRLHFPSAVSPMDSAVIYAPRTFLRGIFIWLNSLRKVPIVDFALRCFSTRI